MTDYSNTGMRQYMLKSIIAVGLFFALISAAGELSYSIVGTGQNGASSGKYRENHDKTVTDLQTGLMWVKGRGKRVTYQEAISGAAACRVGGYSDWRMPTIKELYSLILFSGVNGRPNQGGKGYVPFIDKNFFEFVYGNSSEGLRIIDSQDWSANENKATSGRLVFGVNFADGRIKSYPKYKRRERKDNELYVRYVRENSAYGINRFKANGEQTVSDLATGLMWSRSDSETGMDYPTAKKYVKKLNQQKYLGYQDWRVPTAKELQSIVDYTRSPDVTKSPAINSVFKTSSILNEAGKKDYPYFWTSSQLNVDGRSPEQIYIAFGRALGFMRNQWVDIHGAGAQRSDPPTGDPTQFKNGRGPQGDAVRIQNYIRVVRTMSR